jgi:hypothetical protein
VLEPTHEEMLEVAAEREKEAEVLQIAVDAMEKHDKAFKELAAIEAAEREEVAEFLDVMAEEAFANLGEQDFFDPTPKEEPVVVAPEPVVHVAPPAPAPAHVEIPLPQSAIPPREPAHARKAPRYILRKDTRSRKG